MGGKNAPTSFSPVAYTNLGISPKSILPFTFNSFDILVEKFKAIPSASPKVLNLNQEDPSKKFFCSNAYKIEVMITSVIEILELPNLGHMTLSTI